MVEQLNKVKKLWSNVDCLKANQSDIERFQKINEVSLPKDMIQYFKLLNGTDEKYDEFFFNFYSFHKFESIDNLYRDWEGIPNYKGVLKTLPDYNKYYVFADYNINLFCYAIRLYKAKRNENEILVVCGEKYKKIANSFTEFLDLYLCDSDRLQY